MNEFLAASGANAGDVRLLFYGVLITIAITWSAWCTYGHLQLWREGDVDIVKATTRIFTSLVMISILGFYL